MKKNWLVLVLLLSLAVIACEKDRKGKAERAGEKVDQKLEEAGDKIDKKMHKAGDKIEENLDKAGDKINEKTNR